MSKADLILKCIAPTPEERARSARQWAEYDTTMTKKQRFHISKEIVLYTFHLRAIGMSFDELAELKAKFWRADPAYLLEAMLDEYKKRGGK